MNKNKVRLAIGWFGVLTPVYAAGVLTVIIASGFIDASLIIRIVAVSIINGFVGWKILKVKLPVEGGKKHASNASRS